ncbi:Response regulator receiver domain-containing protein [Chitinophaga sp. CF118]|uniref:response regulator n=1 Tax=Chitinophaga sp. CF118 TaxID=1884367 RepID=UPI0008F2A25D|nr:response regulator [Chitinophaga sp. CF118]SFD04847.1 Response regulator receiver domain-containing protein [Chitinophaga sp. CF118]
MQENSKQVYVVDDDEIFHFILKKMLEQQSEKLEVTSFLCAEEAIAKLQCLPVTSLPSLIILDMNMQRMNGWDFIEAYRDIQSAIQQQIPIIMCSSSMDMRDMQKVKRTPELKAYITKPLDPSKVKLITDCLA